jgi:hypothetical protein
MPVPADFPSNWFIRQGSTRIKNADRTCLKFRIFDVTFLKKLYFKGLYTAENHEFLKRAR